MSNAVLIIGESGTGKSTAIRTLDPKETFIINVISKPLPFRGAHKSYFKRDKENEGNMASTDMPESILTALDKVNKLEQFKNIIIDDFQYVMSNEFMRRSSERGYDKFTEIGKNAWSIVDKAKELRGDLNVFVLSHSDKDFEGKTKMKTIGKMLDDKICIEGLFTVVFNSMIIDGEYKFLTQNDGNNIAKSPMEMFDKYIPNDLQFVCDKMNEYYSCDEDIPQ